MKDLYAKFFSILSRIFMKLALISNRFGTYFNRAVLVKEGSGKNLYQVDYGIKLWLGEDSVIDRSLIETRLWEPQTTALFKRLIKQDDVVIDIGANIGYFTILFAKLVGENGKVYAFEPTNHYFEMLKKNVLANSYNNIEYFKKGLSNKDQELEIKIDNSTATFHQPLIDSNQDTEMVSLITLDNFISNNELERIDVIKIDIDGHEPFVLEGGIKSIQKFKPMIVLEISHLHYLKAGITAWDFYDNLKSWGFHIFLEKDYTEVFNKTDFLINCGDFSHSVNVLLSMDSDITWKL